MKSAGHQPGRSLITCESVLYLIIILQLVITVMEPPAPGAGRRLESVTSPGSGSDNKIMERENETLPLTINTL